MPVLKAQELRRAQQSSIVMDLSDLEAEAGEIVRRARVEAAKIVAEARAAAERDGVKLREDAKNAGCEEGFQAGREAGAKQAHDEAVAQTARQFAELIARWDRVLDIFQQHMPVHLADTKTDLVRLALAVAERVTHQQIARGSAAAEATIEQTLRLIGEARKVVLHVNPEELASLEEYLPALVSRMRTLEFIELRPDKSVSAGGCVARFGAGEVDARIETQIARITAELLAGQEEPRAAAGAADQK